MPTNRWLPKQKKTAQVVTTTITAADAGTTYKILIGSKFYTSLGLATVTLIATDLYTQLIASTEPEFQRITWTNPSAGVVKGVAKIAGTPFTVVFSVSGGAGTLSQVATTANTSPNDINDALNWTLGATPVNGDDVLFDVGGTNESALWNLGALSAITANSITRKRSFKGRIGLPEINTDASPFTEYLATEFALGLQGAFAVLIEQPSSDRPEQIKLNTGTTQTTLTIQGDSPGSINSECLWWRGTHASNVVNVEGGSLAVAPVASSAATIATLTAKGVAVRLGSGVTLATFNNLGATAEIAGTFTTLTQQGGSTTQRGNAINLTTCTVQGGRFTYMATGTITTMVIGSAGVVDFTKDNRARTVTNKISGYRGATLLDTAGSTIAAGVSYQAIGCKQSDLRFDFGPNHSFTVAL